MTKGAIHDEVVTPRKKENNQRQEKQEFPKKESLTQARLSLRLITASSTPSNTSTVAWVS